MNRQTEIDDAEDARLLARVLAGKDRGALGLLLARHQGSIRTLLRRLARGDTALADDLAQNTMLRALLSLEQFHGLCSLRTWLYRIACNEFFQHYRRTRRERSSGEEAGDFEESPAVSGSDGRDMAIDVERAMAVLSAPEREAILVCYYADLSHSEAATLIACPLGTLKSHITRAQLKLREQLAAWAPAKSEAL